MNTPPPTATDALWGMVAHHDEDLREEAALGILHEIRRRQRRSIMTSSTLKVCPGCDTAKAHDAYRRNASRADGLDGLCRSCRNTTLGGL